MSESRKRTLGARNWPSGTRNQSQNVGNRKTASRNPDVGARLRTTRKGRKDALTAHAAGRLVRELHLGAVWNAASLPNAMIAQVCFVPLALSETRDKYHGVLLMLLPACLLVTKLLEAQAFKALAACAGVTGPVWAMLIKADAHARTAHAAALAGRAW